MWDGSGSRVGATAKDIARAVRRGDTSATQVVAEHLDYIAAQESALGAFRVIRAAAAITEAEAVDEQDDLANLPLAGVPIAVKENTPVAGLPTWYGSAAARQAVAEEDHEVVRRLRGAGAIVVATSRMPELGLWGTTDDQTAITRNPWRTDRTPGGSSGGRRAARPRGAGRGGRQPPVPPRARPAGHGDLVRRRVPRRGARRRGPRPAPPAYPPARRDRRVGLAPGSGPRAGPHRLAHLL